MYIHLYAHAYGGGMKGQSKYGTMLTFGHGQQRSWVKSVPDSIPYIIFTTFLKSGIVSK